MERHMRRGREKERGEERGGRGEERMCREEEKREEEEEEEEEKGNGRIVHQARPGSG